MIGIVLDFANIKKTECTSKGIIKIFASNNFLEITKSNSGGFVSTINIDDTNIDLFNCSQCDEQRIAEWATDISNDVKKILQQLTTDCHTDMVFFNTLISNLNINIVPILDKEDNNAITIKIVTRSKKTKDHILFNGIISKIIDGKLHEIQRIRRCPKCGIYFYAKDIRKLFCSTRCKNAHIYLQRKDHNK